MECDAPALPALDLPPGYAAPATLALLPCRFTCGISAVVLVGVVAAEPEGSVCGTDDGETLLLALPVPRSDPDVFFVGPRVYERCPCP